MLSLFKKALKSRTQTINEPQKDAASLSSKKDTSLDDSKSKFASLWQAAEHENKEGNYEKARDYLYQALEIDPSRADLLYQLGALENKMDLHEDAIDNLLTAIHIDPNLIEAYFSLGTALADIEKFDEAIEFFEKGISVKPDNASMLCGLANVYMRQEKFAEAVPIFEQAIEKNPGHSMAYNNLGHCYMKLQQYETSLLPLKISLALDPYNVKAYINIGYVYYTTGDLRKSYYFTLKGLKLDPSNETLRWALCWSLLLFKRYKAGWIEYEQRFLEGGKTERRHFDLPLWQGEDLSGKTILIASEQGLGDQIMFASCLDEITSAAKTCILECDAKLTSLFKLSFPHTHVIGTQYKKEQEVLEELAMPIDYYTHIGSLPSRFRNSYESFFPAKAYLTTNNERMNCWNQRISELGDGLKIGISWRGGAVKTRSFLRTIPLTEWGSILKTANVHFINLQYGDSQQDLTDCFEQHGVAIHNWPDAVDDYPETAALIKSLDLVISVCTSVIHLSGALGQKTWVMVPASPEWRYLARDEYLPWYPHVRLFRQPSLENWQAVLEDIAQHLAALTQGGEPS